MQSNSSTNIFLTGVMLFANMDFSGLADYAIKAIIGGAIWMCFKLGSDYLTERMKKGGKE